MNFFLHCLTWLNFRLLFSAGLMLCALQLAAQPQYSLAPGKKIVLKSSLFQSGSAALEKEGRETIYFIVQYLKSTPALIIEISGHCDNQGDPTLNKALAQARADAVRQYMISLDIAAERITTRSYGDKQPIAPNDTESGRAENRRVEIVGLSAASQQELTNKQGKAIEADGKLTLIQKTVQTLAPWDVDWKDAEPLQPIYELHKINTADKSRATVTFNDKSQLHIADNSLVVIYRSQGKQAIVGTSRRESISLVRGGLWLKLQEANRQKTPVIVRTESSEISLEQAAKISSDEQGRALVSVHQGKAEVMSVMANDEITSSMSIPENFGTRVAQSAPPETPRPLPPLPVLTTPSDSLAEMDSTGLRIEWAGSGFKTRLELADAVTQRVWETQIVAGRTAVFRGLRYGRYMLFMTALDSVGLESKREGYPLVVVPDSPTKFRWIEFGILVGAVALMWHSVLFRRRTTLAASLLLFAIASLLFYIR
jgi:hypothetical protein